MMFDRLLGRGERVYHTGGYLGDGQKIWLLARIPGDIVLNGDDVIEPYLLFSNSHDGSLAIDIRLTTIRVVCQNTLSMALHSRGPAQKPFRRAHQFDLSTLVQKAEDFLKFTLRQTEETKRLFEQLAKKACEPSSFESFLKALLPDPTKPEAIAPVTVLRSFESRLDKAVRTRAGILSVHNDGIKERKIPPAPETWWGALNSVTAWVDHLQETKSDRYAHVLFGSGDRLKGIALNQILAKAGHASVPI